MNHPVFPQFKLLGLEDRGFLAPWIRSVQPRVSELTFTNLFMWRGWYNFRWSIRDEHLLIVTQTRFGIYAMEPVGHGSRTDAALALIGWIRTQGEDSPAIERAGEDLAAEFRRLPDFVVTPQREHFDYVYRTEDLIELKGRRLHSKKNHLNQFTRTHNFRHRPLTYDLVQGCLDMSDRWCRSRNCCDDLSLCAEWTATREAMTHFETLGLTGSVVLVDNSIEAFAVGERLNDETMVIHIEKATAGFSGLYAFINQQFCEYHCRETAYVNREQDLGDPGLRKAKESYCPVMMIPKYRIAKR